MIRHPLTFSLTPPRYDLPPPGLDEHGDEIRDWLSPEEEAVTQRSPLPDLDRRLGRGSITLLSGRTWPPT